MDTFGEGSPTAGGIQVGARRPGRSEDRGRGRAACDQQVVGKLAEAAALRTGVYSRVDDLEAGRPSSVSSAPRRRTRRLDREASRRGGRARPDRGQLGQRRRRRSQRIRRHARRP
jgi:hypothetical protein